MVQLRGTEERSIYWGLKSDDGRISFKSTWPARCPYKQKATGGYKHEPFTSISYSIAIMVCAETPKGSSHPPHQPEEEQEKKGEVAASHHPLLLPNTHPSWGGGGVLPPTPPPPVAQNQRESNVPPRPTPPLPLSRIPTPAPGLTKLYRSFSPHLRPNAPRSRCPQAGHPGRLLTGGQLGRAESGAGAAGSR